MESTQTVFKNAGLLHALIGDQFRQRERIGIEVAVPRDAANGTRGADLPVGPVVLGARSPGAIWKIATRLTTPHQIKSTLLLEALMSFLISRAMAFSPPISSGLLHSSNSVLFPFRKLISVFGIMIRKVYFKPFLL